MAFDLDSLVAALEQALPEGASITCRRMFGGVGAYVGDAMFASLSKVGLALKLPHGEQAEIVARGGRPLQYKPGGPINRRYVLLPETMLSRRDLRPWVVKSLRHAQQDGPSKSKPAKKKVAQRKAAGARSTGSRKVAKGKA